MSLPPVPADGIYRILAMEDDAETARLIKVCLQAASFECRYETDGLSGMLAFHEMQPHLVLLDMMMPGRNGEEVCALIRAESQVPIIILTAKNSVEDELVGLKHGADDYMIKPFDPKLLIARVSAQLRRTYRYAADSLETVQPATPLGWAQCETCGYMGPRERFERAETDAAACPYCQGGEDIVFSQAQV